MVELSPEASVSHTLKAWISSILAGDRRLKLFENYASVHEKRRFRRENFDIFVDQLMNNVTTVCLASTLVFYCCLRIFQIYNIIMLLSVERSGNRSCLKALSLKVKAYPGEVTKTELKRTEIAFKAFKEETEREDDNLKLYLSR